MEEKETSTSKKLSYEQLEQVAMQLQKRLIMTEDKLRNIDLTGVRLTWLFKVLENADSFSTEFVLKCAKEIESLLTFEEDTPDTEAENA